MFTGRNYPLGQTILWTKKYILIFLLISAVPVFLYLFFDFKQIVVPWLPISLVGIAVAFYLGFKNNSSYDRLWEARKIWGAIVNSSRSWGILVKGFVAEDFETNPVVAEIRKKLIKRHLAWIHALRFQLRVAKEWEHSPRDRSSAHLPYSEEKAVDKFDVLEKYLSTEDLTQVSKKQNVATHILDLQMQELTSLRKQNFIEDFRHMELANLLKDLFDHQGKCERIKNFPFPRQYASLNIYFVWIFIVLLPFGLIQEFAKIGDQYVWLTIPFSVLISWVFHTMEMIGDYSENPFEGLNNDIPITTISRAIEIDLLEMINDENIPKPLEPVKKILM